MVEYELALHRVFLFMHGMSVIHTFRHYVLCVTCSTLTFMHDDSLFAEYCKSTMVCMMSVQGCLIAFPSICGICLRVFACNAEVVA